MSKCIDGDLRQICKRLYGCNSQQRTFLRWVSLVFLNAFASAAFSSSVSSGCGVLLLARI